MVPGMVWLFPRFIAASKESIQTHMCMRKAKPYNILKEIIINHKILLL